MKFGLIKFGFFSLGLGVFISTVMQPSALAATFIIGEGTIDGKMFSYQINKDKINNENSHLFNIFIDGKLDTNSKIRFIILDSETWNLKSFVVSNLPRDLNLFPEEREENEESPRSVNFDFTNSGKTPMGLDHTRIDITRQAPFLFEVSKFDPVNKTPVLGEGNISRVRHTTKPIFKIPEPSSTLSVLALGTIGAVSTLKRKQKSKSSEK